MIKEQERFNAHEKFNELCAVAMSGTLTTDEWAELKDHMQVCDECREAYQQYQILTTEGISLLAPGYDHREEQESWDDQATRHGLFARIAAVEKHAPVSLITPQHVLSPIHWVARRISMRSLATAALAACLVVAIGFGAYRLGRLAKAPTQHLDSAAENRFQMLAAEKKLVDKLLAAQTLRLTQLGPETSRKESELQRLRSELRALEDRSNQLTAAKNNSEDQLRAISQQRDVLSEQLHDAEQSYQKIQAELIGLRTEHDKATARLTSLEDQVVELSTINRDQERKLKNSEQYLASDRDIRDLMGARQLYIADVFDVSSDSRTRKPYGRVFYTKQKSLIFYAFDLDRQPGRKNAGAFQVWGRKEAEQGNPLNLGILYMDNEANRRWVLRFNDPKQLAEIDAVFVTIEPHGGSQRPSGKPFLYASLRKEVNHP